MIKSKIFSKKNELKLIAQILENYLRLPFTGKTIPGSIMENVLAHVRDGKVLDTYDFVDVVQKENNIGWQVKSTKATTPVTWKRAKIPNAGDLVAESKKSAKGLQKLGDTIISFCNEHAKKSIETYGLNEIGYSRLIVHGDGKATYFEKILCTSDSPEIFSAPEFEWHWSTPKKTQKKEQLPALHGKHRKSNKKWFAWHGLGENQLHFSGEENWWPERFSISFKIPTDSAKLSLVDFLKFIERINQ